MNPPDVDNTPDATHKSVANDNVLSDIVLEDLSPALQAAVARAGWEKLMPVQARAIPYLFDKRDVMIQARTGSGKTGAFVLPLLERIDPTRNTCQVLIMVPTRELARQVSRDAATLCGDSGVRTVPVYGGVGYGPQIAGLKKGAHIVVGTPGRVLDHLLKRTFNLNKLQMLIFDEADRMLSMGFYPDMQEVQRYLPNRQIHTCMFSATFPSSVMRTARQFMHAPEFLSLSSDHIHVTDTEHVFYEAPGMSKDRGLIRIIEIENPTAALIFCNTKARVHYVTVVLQRFGYDADELSSDLAQNARERVLARVRKGKLRLLVATDVAARGLDIPELSHVFQYEPPEDPESYIHRAGRTGRAGASGVAITLVGGVEKYALERIAKRYEIEMEERPLPTDEDVAAVVSERITALLEARLRKRDRLQTERSARFAALAHHLADNEDELPIITMLLDDYYQQMLHAPVAGPAEAQPKPKPSRSPRRRSRRRR